MFVKNTNYGYWDVMVLVVELDLSFYRWSELVLPLTHNTYYTVKTYNILNKNGSQYNYFCLRAKIDAMYSLSWTSKNRVSTGAIDVNEVKWILYWTT